MQTTGLRITEQKAQTVIRTTPIIHAMIDLQSLNLIKIDVCYTNDSLNHWLYNDLWDPRLDYKSTLYLWTVLTSINDAPGLALIVLMRL